MTLTLELASKVVDEALAEARRRNLKPMGVLVVDAGGYPIVYKREDHNALFRYDIVYAKAKGALGVGTDTRAVTERATANPLFFQSLLVLTAGQLALSPGGVVIRDAEGHAIGAVGMSGDTGDQDEACAIVGLVAAGLRKA